MSKRAIILSGGMGTRLRPYTVVLPKPLMPIGEYPILEIIVRQLVKAGFDHITLAVNHQAEIIKAFFGDGSKWNTLIDYSFEDKPLGTVGPLNLISDLPENFLVMNGDVLTDLNFGAFYEEHVNSGRLFTVSSKKRQDRVDYGVLDVNSDNCLIGFREKPQVNYEVSMGIYMFSQKTLDLIPSTGTYGFDLLMLEMLKQKMEVCVEPFSGYWLDIGRPDDYAKAIDEFEVIKERIL
jgi:NDP-mannose synthase